jgi:hypothetical protein
LRAHLVDKDGAARSTALSYFREVMSTQGAAEGRLIFEHIDLDAWIEAQRTGRTFAQVISDRARRVAHAA